MGFLWFSGQLLWGGFILYARAVLGLPYSSDCVVPEGSGGQGAGKTRGKFGYSGFTVESLYADFLKETPRLDFG